MSIKNLLKGVVRAAGALVGSQIGGPAGAALGAGLATKLTGGSNKDALLGGLVSGIGAYALPKVGGKLGLSSDGLFGAPAGAGSDMGYINSEAGTQGAVRGIANLATSPAGLAALGAGALALSPADAPPPAPSAPARDNRTLEEMGYDTSPLERDYMPYQGDPYAYGEKGGEQRFFARGGHVQARGLTFDPESGDYDIDNSSGERDEIGHMGSVREVSPEESRRLGLPEASYLILKGRNHETWHMGEEGEEALGRKVVKRRGRYYAVPQDYARGGHVRRGIAHFDDGGYVSLESITDAGYDPSSVDASGGVEGGLAGTGFDAGPTADSPSIAPEAVDFSVPAGMSVPAMQAPAAPQQSQSLIGRGLSAISSRAQDVVQNPGRSAINAVASGIPVVGPINTISGILGGPTIGGMVVGGVQSATGYGKGSGVLGDADGDGEVTPGDDFANYTGPEYDPGGYASDVSYMDGLMGKVDAGTAAPGTGMASLQPVRDTAAAADTNRQRLFPTFDALRYGEMMPEARFYAANGGMARGFLRGPSPAQMAMAAFERGGKVSGPGDGQSDNIPAMLSDGEYVIDAATVADLGDGSNEAGAKKLDAMRKRIRAQKRRAPTNKIPPKAKGIGHYMGGAV